MTRLRWMMVGLHLMVPVVPLWAATGGSVQIIVTIQQAVSQFAGVQVRAIPRQRRGRPEQTIVHRFRVRNTGNVTDRFQLSAVSSNGWSVSLPDGTLTELLEPRPGRRSFTAVRINVTIPPNTPPGTQDQLVLTATSQFDPSVSAQATAMTIVRRPGP